MPAQPETTTLSTPDGTKITVYTWPAAGPRGVLQITHGMGEHALRYAELAAVLVASGWTVVAQDHRGHGASADSEDVLGQIGTAGWAALVSDIAVVREHAVAQAGRVPFVLFGHSMGSFAVQQYLPANSAPLDGVVLTGTAALDLLEPALDLDAPLDLAMFNAPFAPARTDFDWLSRDPEQVDLYINDPWCGFGLDPDGVGSLKDAAARTADPEALGQIRDGFPLYVLAGSADPINIGLQWLEILVDRYRDHGLEVTAKYYDEGRHEMFNETNRAEVFADLIAWLDGVPALKL